MPLPPMIEIRVGTRTSNLALWQTQFVAELIQQHWPNVTCTLVHMVTQGDKRLDRPLPEIGGKGLFTAELEDALRRNEIDVAVHSLKDLPVDDPDDLTIGAILNRADTRDVLVAREPWTLATLPAGAVVGTSSLRRQAQLLAARPDLNVRSIRGNVDTRLRKVMEGEYDAAVMAGAGLVRLGLSAHISEWLAEDVMLPAPGQGALAVQRRLDDPTIAEILAAIHDPVAAATTTAERQLLQGLGGGCSAPIGAAAKLEAGTLTLRARVASLDGRQVYDAEATGNNPIGVAQKAVATLVAQGAEQALQHGKAQPKAQPLQGKRIVITRPRANTDESDDALATQLRALGAHIVHVPLIEFAKVADRATLADMHARAKRFDWIVFTSATAVAHFLDGVTSVDALIGNGARIAAVGPATRAALEKWGLSVHAMPTTYRGSELANVLGELEGKRVLLPRSQQGSRDLPNALRAAGAQVEDFALYTPVDAPLDERDRRQLLAGIDAITFASGSAVRALAAALHDDERFIDYWARVAVICIGPSTAEVAQSLNIPVSAVASEHTAAGLAAAVAGYFA